mgnify:CR=1 FL=1
MAGNANSIKVVFGRANWSDVDLTSLTAGTGYTLTVAGTSFPDHR